MQKLLIIYPNQFGYHTDSYMYCKYLQKSYDISYVCFDQGFKKLLLPHIEVVYVPYNVGKIKRLYLFLSTAIHKSRQLNNSIAFVIQFKFSWILGLFLKSKLKILDYRTGDLSKNNFIRKINNTIMRLDAFFFQKVSVISEGLRDTLWLKNDAFILPLGAEELSDSPKTFERLHLLYVGAIHHRNIFETVEGLALFLRKYSKNIPPITYDIIGFGNQQDIELLHKTIDKNNLQQVVFYHARKAYHELSPFFDKCNIGVSYIPVTDYYQHQPSTKTFEYALSGLFTIATNTLENKKVINEVNGVLCNDNPESFAGALDLVFKNKGNFKDKLIRESLQAFHWKKIVDEKLIQILKP